MKTNKISCKFCGNDAPNNMQGYCQACYRYFVMEGKIVYPPYEGPVQYAPNGDVICPVCGKAYRKMCSHTWQAHNLTSKELFKKFGWKERKVKATCKEYRVMMKDIQHAKCITENLVEHGNNYSYSGNFKNHINFQIRHPLN